MMIIKFSPGRDKWLNTQEFIEKCGEFLRKKLSN
jgi:hypothetical protein